MGVGTGEGLAAFMGADLELSLNLIYSEYRRVHWDCFAND